MSLQQVTSGESTVSRGSSVAASAGLGVFAAVIGYAVTYALIIGEVREAAENFAEWKGVGWYFYSAHMVDIETSGSGEVLGFSFGSTETQNVIAQASSSNADLLYFVPPLVLLAVGAFLAVRWNATDLGEAVSLGAPVTIGYAVVMGLGAVVTRDSVENVAPGIEASQSVEPLLVPAILLGGIIYPLVFATAGAAIATAFNER